MEAYAIRERALNNRVGSILSPARPLFIQTAATNGTYNAGDAFFFALAVEPNDTVVSQVRINVAGIVANAAARVALYVKDAAELSRLRKIATTEVDFDCSTTGVKTTDLEHETVVPGNRLVFLALLSTNAPDLASIATGGSATTSLFPVMYVTTSELPAEVDASKLATTHTTRVPMVAYLSPDFAEVF
jgi:hypothetical protein